MWFAGAGKFARARRAGVALALETDKARNVTGTELNFTERLRLARYVVRISGRFLVQRAKDAVGIAIGRAPYTSQLDGFFYRHWRHLLRLRAIRKVTADISCAGEGAGSRALMTMFVIGLSREFGLPYRHTAFAGITHTIGDQLAWDRAWEEFFNLGAGERAIEPGEEPETFDYHLLTFLKTARGSDLTQFVRPALPALKPIYYTDLENIEHERLRAVHAAMWNSCLDRVLPDLRGRYRAANPRPARGAFTVCIHIRRGDVGAERADMWTDNASYARCLDAVADALDKRGIAFECHLFSQGSPADFAGLVRPEIRLRLDEDPFASLRAMIDADVLIMSKSCFSHVAAMLGDGIPIYERNAIPPMDNWVERGAAGNPDLAALERRLDAARGPSATGPSGPRP